MHLFDQPILGVAILLLLLMLVSVKQASTGSILEKPAGNLLAQLVNIFNLFFLLVVNPLAAIALIMPGLPQLDPTHFTVPGSWLLTGVEILALQVYVAGFGLMAWALSTLGRNYQLGGSEPRAEDQMVTDGPYTSIRHPMYTAALCISLGLAWPVQSWAFLSVFIVYLILILALIPMEEQGLQKAYGAADADYQRRTRMLLPSVC